MKSVLIILCAAALCGCYGSSTLQPATVCEDFCDFAIECEGGTDEDAALCADDCSTSPWWEATTSECRAGVQGLMSCVSSLTCDQAEEYNLGEPFSDVPYPCKELEEFATFHECGGDDASLWR